MVSLKGYFAKPEPREAIKARVTAIKEKQRKNTRIVQKKKKPPKKRFAEDGTEEDYEDDESSSEGDEDLRPVGDPVAEETPTVPEEEIPVAEEEVKDEGATPAVEEEKKGEEVKKQSVFDEDLGGIEINIIGEDGRVRQGKTFEHNRHLPKGFRRPGIRTDRKIYGDD